MKRIYYFLGSIYFALILMATTVVTVIVGTFLESITGSHRLAAFFTYGSPLFSLLLVGFFVNILVSALRRWPFRWHHFPFLLTHLGLLMVIAGVLIKIYFGTQGSMFLVEGSGSHQLFLPDTEAIALESRQTPSQTVFLPLQPTMQHGELSIRVLKTLPHHQESLETWIKGGYASLFGLQPFPLAAWNDLQAPFPDVPQGKIALSTEWAVYGIQTPHVEEALQRIQSQSPALVLIHTPEKVTHLIAIDKKGRMHRQQFNNQEIASYMLYDNGFGPRTVTASIPANLAFLDPQAQERALQWKIEHTLRQEAEQATLLSPPLQLLRAQCQQQQVDFAAAFISFLRHWQRVGGWLYPNEAPLPTDLQPLFAHLDWSLLSEPEKKACLWTAHFFDEISQSQTFSFLELLHQRRWPLYAEVAALPAETEQMALVTQQIFSSSAHLPAKDIAYNTPTLQARLLSAYLRACGIHLTTIYPAYQTEDKQQLLHDYHTALYFTAHAKRLFSLLPSLSIEQLSTMIARLPDHASALQPLKRAYARLILKDVSLTGTVQAEALAHYLHAYAPRSMQPFTKKKLQRLEETLLNPTLTVETAITRHYEPLASQTKWEDNLPLLTLQLQEGNKKENLLLPYDIYGTGYKQPVLQGRYRLRFQSMQQPLPYHVRLRQARQLFYPDSTQTYSYESTLLVTNRQTQQSTEVELSMNRVHETWDGYRFYLASLSSANETAVKQVKLIINHDPAKYFLTYPGAGILAIGIFSLFWLRPSIRNRFFVRSKNLSSHFKWLHSKLFSPRRR